MADDQARLNHEKNQLKELLGGEWELLSDWDAESDEATVESQHWRDVTSNRLVVNERAKPEDEMAASGNVPGKSEEAHDRISTNQSGKVRDHPTGH